MCWAIGVARGAHRVARRERAASVALVALRIGRSVISGRSVYRRRCDYRCRCAYAVQVRRLPGDALDVVLRRVQQSLGEVAQCARHRELVADLGHARIERIALRLPDAGHVVTRGRAEG